MNNNVRFEPIFPQPDFTYYVPHNVFVDGEFIGTISAVVGFSPSNFSGSRLYDYLNRDPTFEMTPKAALIIQRNNVDFCDAVKAAKEVFDSSGHSYKSYAYLVVDTWDGKTERYWENDADHIRGQVLYIGYDGVLDVADFYFMFRDYWLAERIREIVSLPPKERYQWYLNNDIVPVTAGKRSYDDGYFYSYNVSYKIVSVTGQAPVKESYRVANSGGVSGMIIAEYNFDKDSIVLVTTTRQHRSGVDEKLFVVDDEVYLQFVDSII